MKSSWVPLLLALMGAFQAERLPAALEQLVRNSPISSIHDLQLLLLTDSVDEEEGNLAVNGGHRLPRSLDAQPAQQALCKVRTEVVEVTRAMLDRTNANFLLWPPCVEVQRCSGCCNTKSLRCVSFVTHTRHLQVMKIEYVNKRPTYAKAVVSVVDDVECRCQPAPRPPLTKRKSSRRQHGHKDQHGNQTLSRGQVEVHSKDAWDELKYSQGSRLEDFLEEHWGSRGDTFTLHREGYSLAGEGSSPSAEVWAQNYTGFFGTEGQTGVRDNGGTSEGNKTMSSVDVVDQQLVEGRNRLMFNSTEEDVHEGGRGEDAQSHSRSKAQNSQARQSRLRPTQELNLEPGNDTPEDERVLQDEEERKELLVLHKRLDHEKEKLRRQQKKLGEEEEQKEKETDHQHHLHTKHLHHTQKTTEKPALTPLKKPAPPADLRPSAHPKRRTRKKRKRISKAAMRAMLM